MNKPAYTCCDSPDPAILEKNGRLFCRNCRSYLDKPSDGLRPTGEPDARLRVAEPGTIAAAGGTPLEKRG